MNATFDSEVSFSPERDDFESRRNAEMKRDLMLMRLARENIRQRERRAGVYVYKGTKAKHI